jgi:hypothetical protein
VVEAEVAVAWNFADLAPAQRRFTDRIHSLARFIEAAP